MTNASLPTDPIARLWRHARAWLAEMLCDFISPARVARTIAHHARIAFRKRLQALELLVLKLLLIEATRVAYSNHPFPGRGEAASPGPMPTSRERKVVTRAASHSHNPVFIGPGLGAARQSGNGWPEHPDHPITWRVRFHTPGRPQSTAAPTRRAPPRAPACAQTLALRLARRFEALRRVIADPRRAIAALARKLAALGTAARALARRIALAAPRNGGGPIFADATVYAHDACSDLPDDTS